MSTTVWPPEKGARPTPAQGGREHEWAAQSKWPPEGVTARGAGVEVAARAGELPPVDSHLHAPHWHPANRSLLKGGLWCFRSLHGGVARLRRSSAASALRLAYLPCTPDHALRLLHRAAPSRHAAVLLCRHIVSACDVGDVSALLACAIVHATLSATSSRVLARSRRGLLLLPCRVRALHTTARVVAVDYAQLQQHARDSCPATLPINTASSSLSLSLSRHPHRLFLATIIAPSHATNVCTAAKAVESRRNKNTLRCAHATRPATTRMFHHSAS